MVAAYHLIVYTVQGWKRKRYWGSESCVLSRLLGLRATSRRAYAGDFRNYSNVDLKVIVVKNVDFAEVTAGAGKSAIPH